jgi:diaminopimelate epimerase
MHGLGNDFVVLDARRRRLTLDSASVQRIADRHRGVGCDQLIAIEPSQHADAFMRIYNADGGEVAACGNGTRCVAWLLFRETGRHSVTIETRAGLLRANAATDGLISVDMGPARLDWRDIPLARAMDTNHLPLSAGDGLLLDPAAVCMGNPHAVFFVTDVMAVPLAELGPRLEHDPLFPERANIGIAEMRSRSGLRLRVWERGVGITAACGSGACAAAVAAVRRGLADRRLEVELDGGRLMLEWRQDGHVLMTGPVATSFTGELSPELLAP